MEEPPQPGPRLIRKVAVGYDLNALPPSVIRCFTLLRRKLERAGYQIEVGLRPLADLPADLDVLFVSSELVPSARLALPAGEVKCLNLAAGHQTAFDELLSELDSGQKLGVRLPAGDDPSAGQRREIQRYRGHDRVF
jgi:hypothetical protein